MTKIIMAKKIVTKTTIISRLVQLGAKTIKNQANYDLKIIHDNAEDNVQENITMTIMTLTFVTQDNHEQGSFKLAIMTKLIMKYMTKIIMTNIYSLTST